MTAPQITSIIPTIRPIAEPHYFASANPAAGVTPSYAGSAVAYGKSPNVIRSAYGLGVAGSSLVQFNGFQGDGTGQTIAIVDAYDFPTAGADLNAFSTAFGLPTLTINTTSLAAINSASGPTFTKVSQTGSLSSLPGSDPSGPYATTGKSTWEQEEALDIEWAHVMAPQANIVLVEATSPTNANLIQAAAGYARTIPGVVAVSMSFGGSEFSTEINYDTFFTSPTGHQGGSATAGGTLLAGGVTFLASAGDSGAYARNTTTISPQYPAASPNVVAVGGTTLNLNATTNAYVSESAWGNSTTSGTKGGGGGGISTYEAQPSYQSSTVSAFSTNARTYPDLAIEADPNTGVPIYDSWDFGATTPWIPGYEGGTSLSCPMMAGLVAVADQGRAINGLGSLDGSSATLPAIYSIAATNYNDITSGNNGYAAGPGYDLATGRGSPIANLWVYAIGSIPSSGGTVTGEVFRDVNANATIDAGETALNGAVVYLDENNDGVRQATDPIFTINSGGIYTFTDLAVAVSGTVRLLTVPTGYVAVNVPTFSATSTSSSTANIGLFPIAYTDASAAAAYVVRTSPTASTQLQIVVNGTVAYTAPASLSPSLAFTFTGAADTIAVDFGNGDPVPAGGLSVNGSAASNGDTLSILGTTGNDTITFNAVSVVFGTKTITYSSMPNLSVDPRAGTDSLTVNGTTVTVPAQSAGGGFLARTFSTLAIGASGKLALNTATARTDRSVVVVTTPANLSIAATGALDLGGNDLIVKGGSLSTVSGLVTTGFAAGAWTGAGGIVSSVAAADTTRATALGTILGSTAANASTFDGQSISAADVLVKFTYYGDTNLDGVVNISDYTRTDVGYISTNASGWANGDFNYDGVIDGSDYTLIDNAFNNQSGTL